MINADHPLRRQMGEMINRQRALAELSVPRYTSYPTAPQFSSGVGAKHYASWLSTMPGAARLSLYIHVPYCAELCHYCGCHTKAVRRRAPIDAYADRLIQEIELVAAIAGRRSVVHLHWGGGTPSILGAERIEEIFAKLNDAFDVAADCEHAIELDPRYVSPELARALAGIGATRASLGVQDFTARVQHSIGRVQPFEVVERAALTLRERGIDQINLDLMYGLPQQSVDDVRRSAELAAALDPRRIAYFGYAHVPWLKPHQRLIDEATLPGAVERLAQAEAARRTLVAFDYQAIGLDHFARPSDDLALAARAGRLRRNFQGYTSDQAEVLIGLGASAIGRLPQGFVQNAPDVGGYARAMAAGRLATTKGIALSEDDRIRGRIIERLMCDFSVDLAAVGGERGADAGGGFAAEIEALAPLAAEGLVVLAENRVTVSESGRPFVRLAAAAFDAYLAQARARHSLAV